MVWIGPDEELLVGIDLILEGYGKIINHTFPPLVHVGDSIFGTVTIRNDGDLLDNFRIVVTRQDNSDIILDTLINNLETGLIQETESSTPFSMPNTPINLLIETFHEE